MSNKMSKVQYYTITLQKGLNLLVDADRCSRTFSETVKQMAEKYSTQNWDSSPIADYMDAYLNAKVLKDFIQKKVQSPDEELVRFAAKNKIDGILLTKNELTMLQTLVSNFEETKEYLQKNYGFSTILN